MKVAPKFGWDDDFVIYYHGILFGIFLELEWRNEIEELLTILIIVIIGIWKMEIGLQGRCGIGNIMIGWDGMGLGGIFGTIMDDYDLGLDIDSDGL